MCRQPRNFSLEPRLEKPNKNSNPPSSGDISKVGLGDPRIPVRFQGGSSLDFVLVLTKSPFVDDSGVPCRVEQGGGDPRL